MTVPLSLWWPQVDASGNVEKTFLFCFCREHSHRALIRWRASAQWVLYDLQEPLADVLHRSLSEHILWVTDPSVLLNPFGVQSLMNHADFWSLYAPVYLHSELEEQRAVLPFPYQDPTTYEEVAQETASAPHKATVPVLRVDSRCFLVSVSRIRGEFPKPSSVSVEYAARVLAEGGGFVEPRAFFHTFLPLDEHSREDLAALVPEEVLRILDVGCSSGLYGITVKQTRPSVFLAGVELDPCKAQRARKIYDVVYEGSFEDIMISGPFDLVNCGDVLEHLSNPWTALEKIQSVLRPGGYLVLSVPNIGHWTVVRSLLQGSLEYLPAGLLNRGHLRWFTEISLRSALEDAGFVVEYFERRQPPPTPQGRLFLESLQTLNSIGISQQSLLTETFLVRARKPNPGDPR